jgi:hypothetical protein
MASTSLVAKIDYVPHPALACLGLARYSVKVRSTWVAQASLLQKRRIDGEHRDCSQLDVVITALVDWCG